MASTTYPDTLRGQVRFYQQQAAAWTDGPGEQRRELESILAFALSLFDQFQKIDAEIANELRARNRPVTPEMADEAAALYTQWYGPCEIILKAIKKIKESGERVERSDDFARACQRARVPAFHLREWIERETA
jgi:hypothetical protein